MPHSRNHRICRILPGNPQASRLVAILALQLLTACSFSFINDGGNRVILGPSLVRTAAPGSSGPACNLLHPVEISSLGIAMHSGLGAITAGIGFQNFRNAALRNECPQTTLSEPTERGDASARPSNGKRRFVLYTSLPNHVRGDPGKIVLVETYGFSVVASETGTDITIGYSEVGLAAINNDSLIQGNPLTDIARLHSGNTD